MVLPSLAEERYRVDVDFSLAIHNRTGKYFIGKELLGMADLPLGDVHYWRFARPEVPSGFTGRCIGRLQHMHVLGRTIGGPLGFLPRRQIAAAAPAPRSLHRADDRAHAARCRADHDVGPLTHQSCSIQSWAASIAASTRKSRRSART